MVPIAVITLFVLGFLALVADDLKRVLAYSTVSQLGYMMAAMAAGGYTAGLFHLFTHAFFKGLLFLGAGSVIHSVHSNNMSDMGGLRKDMPVTFWTFVIGSVSLAGIIPFAGFFSKDEILVTLGDEGYVLFMWVAIAGAFITAFYMTRAVALTFFGTYKGAKEGHSHPHESPRVMTWPLVALAVPSVIAGLFNIPGVSWPGIGNFTDWVGARVVAMGDHHASALDWGLAAAGLGAAGLGIVLGWLIFSKDAETQQARDKLEVPVLYPLLRNKYYIDDLYMGGVVNPIKGPIARGDRLHQRACDRWDRQWSRLSGRRHRSVRLWQLGSAGRRCGHQRGGRRCRRGRGQAPTPTDWQGSTVRRWVRRGRPAAGHWFRDLYIEGGRGRWPGSIPGGG